MLRSIGLPELLIILGIAVLIFGGKKIPEVAKGLGEGIRNFKTALKGEEKPEEKKERMDISQAEQLLDSLKEKETDQPFSKFLIKEFSNANVEKDW